MVEPQAYNPLAAVYRWFTPSMRTPDEHPLVPADYRLMRRYFGQVDVQAYGLTSLISLAFVFLPNVLSAKERLFRAFSAVDRVLFRCIPPLKHLAWTVFVRCSKPLAAED